MLPIPFSSLKSIATEASLFEAILLTLVEQTVPYTLLTEPKLQLLLFFFNNAGPPTLI